MEIDGLHPESATSHEQAAHRLPDVDAADRLGQERRDREHREVGQVLVGGERHGVRGHDLGDVGLLAESRDGSAGEKAVRAADRDPPHPPLAQPLQHLQHRPAIGDLVVHHDDILAAHLAHDRIDHDPVVAETLLAARRHRDMQQARELRGRLGVAEVGRDDHGVAKIAALEVLREYAERIQMIDRGAEKAVHLGRVEGHRQHAVGPRRHQQIGDEASADRDARRVLLVGARVGVVGHDRRDARGGGPARGVEHHQECHQVLLDRRDERLDDEDVALAAIRVQLHPEAIVAKAADRRRIERQPQMGADLLGQLRVRAAAENPDLPHLPPIATPCTARAAGD